MRLMPLFVLTALTFLGACSGGKDTDTGRDTAVDTGDSDTDSGDTGGSTDADGDGYAAGVDCNDANYYVNPGVAEVCDGADNNCDGQTDEGVTQTYYRDGDNDGYGSDSTTTGCTQPAGYARTDGDCDDTKAAYHPRAPETDCTDPNDYNCDGSVGAVDTDHDGYYACEECDDGDVGVNPTAAEVCNGTDDDCDGQTDVGAVDAATFYTDADADGYGDSARPTTACEAPAGTTAADGDCDDTDPAYHPDAAESDCTDPNDYNCDGSTGYADADADGYAACAECDDADGTVNADGVEACDGIDNDCDGLVDESGSTGLWYLDLDGDGWGDDAATASGCTAPDGYVATGGDCDDLDESTHPGATEDCADATDYNCDGSVGYVDADADGVAACEDCDDTNPVALPGGVELCDGADNDCDGGIDNAAVDATTWYADVDADGYGDAGAQRTTCDTPSGFVTDGSDCDDTDSAFHPDAPESCTDGSDYNCDGSTGYADADADGYAACAECDDGNADVNASAIEACDGIDNNCDGSVDEAGATGESAWYLDADADGYGDPTVTVTGCTAPAGYVADATDCDDGDPAFHPGADESSCTDPADYNCDGSTGYADADADGTPACEDCDDTDAYAYPGAPEVCDGLDNDCNTYVDEGVTTPFYADADADGYGDVTDRLDACDAPTGYVLDANDCDDVDGSSFPGGSESCDGADNDCDGSVDDGVTLTFFLDADGDGAGDAAVSVEACAPPVGYVADSSDCDDADANAFPGATEICDGVDNDCDTVVDNSAVDTSTFFADADGDGFGDAVSTVEACEAPVGYVADANDCDDTDTSAYPGATEICDGVDNDCDGVVDNGAVDTSAFFADADADGYGDVSDTVEACEAPGGYVADSNDCDDTDANAFPGATEICDGVDNDCDSAIDNGAVDTSAFFADADGDGFGDGSATVEACSAPGGYVDDSNDCDDTEGTTYPGAFEACDGVDNDCDTVVDNGCEG